MSEPNYAIYPTLLDAFTSWQNSGEIWEKYWGRADNPPCTPDEFEQGQLRELIDKINRVPQPFSEAAERGTAFNAILDSIVAERWTEGLNAITTDGEGGEYQNFVADFRGHVYRYGRGVVEDIAGRLRGAIAQQAVEGVISTHRGDVRLYGYADYIMPSKVIDLKTTSAYAFGKYATSWQRYVYPYCLEQRGCDIDGLEFLVVEFKKPDKGGNYTGEIYREFYNWRKEEHTRELQQCVADFVDFVEAVRGEITDNRIFNK